MLDLQNKYQRAYLLLGLLPGASFEEIRLAYLRLRKLHGPQHNNVPDVQKYKDILWAYQVLGGTTNLPREDQDIEILKEEGQAYFRKEQRKKEYAHLRAALLSGLPFFLALTSSAYAISGIFLIAGSGLLVLWLSQYGLFSDETARRMKIILPLCVSMSLFFAEQNYSWRMRVIPVIVCFLVWVMPKNLFTKDLRQHPSTWEKWE